jgi:IS30 family transposase
VAVGGKKLKLSSCREQDKKRRKKKDTMKKKKGQESADERYEGIIQKRETEHIALKFISAGCNDSADPYCAPAHSLR